MSEHEQAAREQGWKPESEWKGEPPSGGFKTAEQFVKDGEQIPGILKSQIGRLEERLDRSEAANAEFSKYHDSQIKKSLAENSRLISELQQTRAQAITDGDGPAFEKADRDIKDLEPVVQIDPNVEAYNKLSSGWVADSKWYGSNKKLTGYADGIADGIAKQGYTGQAYFNELDRQIEEVFPEEFSNPNRQNAPSVETGGDKGSSNPTDQTWANLPAEDKAQAERFINDMPGFTQEKFLDQYEWSE